MKKILTTFPIILFSIIVYFVLDSFSFTEQNYLQEINAQPDKCYCIKPVNIPEKIEFAGELVPVANFDVKESLDRELLINTYWQSQTLLFIKKAPRYFPVMDSILTQAGVPTDFKYLAVVESGLSNVTSPAKAVGFWQFLKGTAQDYGLEVNDEVDERYHLEKSTRAAAKFLKDSYEKYGTWALAAASYNTGRRSLSQQIIRQKTRNYYDLVLGEEAGRYVFRLIALKMILEHPENYGFIVADDEKYVPVTYKLVRVNTPVNHWADWAHEHHINYKTLKVLNPWLRDNKLSNTNHREYFIKVADKKFRNILPNPEFYPEDSLWIK